MTGQDDDGGAAGSLGLLGMFGGALFVCIYVGLSLVGRDAFGTAYTFNVASAFPVLFWIAGTVGLYRHHRTAFGLAGRLGAALLLAGFLVSTLNSAWFLVAGEGLLTQTGALAYLGAEVLGSLLLGAAIVRADDLPHSRSGGVLFAVALPFSLLSFTLVFQVLELASDPVVGSLLFTVPYGTAWLLLGYDLLADTTGDPVPPESPFDPQ